MNHKISFLKIVLVFLLPACGVIATGAGRGEVKKTESLSNRVLNIDRVVGSDSALVVRENKLSYFYLTSISKAELLGELRSSISGARKEIGKLTLVRNTVTYKTRQRVPREADIQADENRISLKQEVPVYVDLGTPMDMDAILYVDSRDYSPDFSKSEILTNVSYGTEERCLEIKLAPSPACMGILIQMAKCNPSTQSCEVKQNLMGTERLLNFEYSYLLDTCHGVCQNTQEYYSDSVQRTNRSYVESVKIIPNESFKIAFKEINIFWKNTP